jgi:hypothetical protein
LLGILNCLAAWLLMMLFQSYDTKNWVSYAQFKEIYISEDEKIY